MSNKPMLKKDSMYILPASRDSEPPVTLPLPASTDISPPLVVPLPAFIRMSPPSAPPLAEDEPDDRIISAPALVSDAPTVTETCPADPPAALLVLTLMLPVSPSSDCPVINSMSPLAPFAVAPPLAVRITILPEVSSLTPDSIWMLPPSSPVASPVAEKHKNTINCQNINYINYIVQCLTNRC